MATIRKKKGKYFVDYRINGRRFRKTTGSSRKIAERTLRDIKKRIFADKSISLKTYHGTYHKKNTIAAQEKAKMQLLFEKVQEGVVIISRKGKFLFANAAAAKSLGYSRESFLALSITDIETKESKIDIEKRFNEVLRGKKVRFETVYRKKNGSMMEVDVSLSEFSFRGRRVIYGIWRDITIYKKAYRRAYMELKKSSLYLDSIADAIVEITPGEKIARINRAFSEIWGYPEAKVVGRSVYKLFPKKEHEKYRKRMKEGINKGIKQKFETIAATSEGGEVPVIVTGSALKNDRGEMSGYLSVFKDITEQKTVEKQLKKFQEALIKTNIRLNQSVLKDPQTGLYNHRYLQDAIEGEFARARRGNLPLSVIMIDIDYFKSINDAYGYEYGDLVIKQFSDHLIKLFRKYDIIGRFGGEEFVVISTGTDKIIALTRAQRVLETINGYKFGKKKQPVRLQLSMGVASYPEDRATKGAQLLDTAENNLNKAKEDGGNRVYDSIAPKGIKTGKTQEGVKNLTKKLEQLARRAHQGSIEAFFAFAKAIELKDDYTGEHVEKTVYYAMEIAKELKLPPGEIELIRQASMMHDLGKVGISEKILLKKTKLTRNEFNEIKKHPQIAVDILRPMHFFREVIPLVYYHHEKCDGSGYPSGLKGDEIPLGARIIAIADVYQALSSDRPYRKAYPHNEVIKIIKESSGSHLDPKIVSTFLKVLKRTK